jgi:hypothetical protein
MGGFASITGQGTYVYADNASFDGTERGGGLTTNGQLWIGNTSTGRPTVNTLTAGTGMVVTNSAGGITLSTSGSSVPNTLTGNSGGAVSPSSGNINVVGDGSITVIGSPGTNTLTTQLTGLTQYSTLVGAGTTTITKIAPSATSGVPYISQGAASNPTFGTAVVAGGGTGNTTFTAYSVICAGTTATGSFQNVSGVGTSGQYLASAGAGALPAWTSLPLSQYTDVSGTATLTANTSYFATAASTLTMPASPSQGNKITVIVDTTGSIVLTANTGQVLRLGGAVSSTAGTLTNRTTRGDSITLVYRSTGSAWIAESALGNWDSA